MLSDYITYMSNKGKEIIKSLSNKKIATSKQDDWRKEGVAIRLKSNDWDSNTNITLLLIPNGKLRIQIYVYDISDDNVNSLREYININKYSKYWAEQHTIRCFGYFDNVDHDIIFNEIADVARSLNNFFLKSKS